MSLVYAKFRETLICYFLTNRKFPFFPLANKGARQVMNLVAADWIKLKFLAFLSRVLLVFWLNSDPSAFLLL